MPVTTLSTSVIGCNIATTILPRLARWTHLITPSDTSAERASHHHLVTVQSWVNLTHGNRYIHGPFDFAIVHGRKTRNRIGQNSWDVLASKPPMFTNRVPRFDLPTYSIHVDHGVHTVFPGMLLALQGVNALTPLDHY